MLSSDPSLGKRKQYHDFAVNRAECEFSIQERVILVSSPTYALIYIIKILSQAVTLVALFTSTCFDPYGSKHVGVKSATNVTACDNILII